MNAPDFLKEVESKLKELAEETDKVKMSEFFKEYLEVVSKFWNYSYHNQMLIYFQNKHAARVAGFVKWKELGRNVKKGSKAIKILAPFKKTVVEVDEKTQEEIETEAVRFYPVNVFDISQTEGKELPEIDVTVTGDNHKEFLKTLIQFCEDHEIKLEFKKLGVNNIYGYSLGGKIVIVKNESVNTQTSTLIHEIAHELIHKKEERKSMSKLQMEIQAEGTAHVVSRYFGLESKSFNYLALHDADYKKIMENLAVIAEAAKRIIEYVCRDE